MQPELLLLDEPTSGLDEAAIERLVGVLAGLPQVMLVVSHHRPFWQAVTSGQLELRAGRIAADQAG
jgi:cobalt/nickel transport system ATP-binding protein